MALLSNATLAFLVLILVYCTCNSAVASPARIVDANHRFRRGMLTKSTNSPSGLDDAPRQLQDVDRRTPLDVLERLPQDGPFTKDTPDSDIHRSDPETRVETLAARGLRLFNRRRNNTEPIDAVRQTKQVTTECRRKSRNRTLRLPGCVNATIDVGSCSGSCSNKQVPSTEATLNNGVFWFPMRGRCKCCTARRYETKKVRLVCLDNVDGNRLLRLKTIQVSVIKKCQCRKCAASP